MQVMDSPVTIRRASTADARAIAEIHVTSWQWAYRNLLPDDYLSNLSIERRAEMHAQRLSAEGESRTWVAEQTGKILGFVIGGPSSEGDVAPRTAQIWAVYILPEAAGHGIGRALLSHAVEDLGQRGYEQATLWVLDTNARARRFYEKAGWMPDGAVKTEERPGALLHEVRYRVRFHPTD